MRPAILINSIQRYMRCNVDKVNVFFSLCLFSRNILSPIWRCCHVCWELVEHHSSSHLLSFSIPWKSDRSFACWKGHWFLLFLLAATKWDILIVMITRSRPRKSAPFLLTRQYLPVCDNYFESPRSYNCHPNDLVMA